MTRFNKLGRVKGRDKQIPGDDVKIPPLDARPMTDTDGRPLTMSEQAEALRDPRNPLSPFYNPNSAGPQMDPRKLRQQKEEAPRPPMGEMLPKEALNDPRFMHGVGSMYAANQPHLKQKRGLSPETVEGLKALEEFNAKAVETQESNVKDSIDKKVENEERENLDKLAKDLGIDPEFFDELRKERDSLDTPELKEATEGRLEPLDIIQMIEEGEIRQAVPVVVGKFVPVFRSPSLEENLEIKRLMSNHKGSDVYMTEVLTSFQLTITLYAINDQPLPSHLNKDGGFDEDKFYKKFQKICKYPVQMVASLAINSSWFDRRCRKLFYDLGPIKNG